jgi:hypothetical protein
VVRRRGRPVDRRRDRLGARANGAVAGRARDRLRGPAADLLAAGTATLAPGRLERRQRTFHRAVPALRDHRAGRVDRCHRRDHLAAQPLGRAAARVRFLVPGHGGALVALLQPRRRRYRASARTSDESRRDGARRLHLPPRGDRRSDHPLRGPSQGGGSRVVSPAWRWQPLAISCPRSRSEDCSS